MATLPRVQNARITQMVQEIDVLREQVRMDHTAKRKLEETIAALRQACEEKNCIIETFVSVTMRKGARDGKAREALDSLQTAGQRHEEELMRDPRNVR